MNSDSSLLYAVLTSSVVAAIISSVVQALVHFLDNRSNRLQAFNERKVDEYFKTLEAYASLRKSLIALGTASSGEKRIEDCTSSQEAEDMLRRDRRGAAAVEEIFRALEAASSATSRLVILGAKTADTDYGMIKSTVIEYLRECMESGRFRAARHCQVVKDFDAALERLIKNSRKELGFK